LRRSADFDSGGYVFVTLKFSSIYLVLERNMNNCRNRISGNEKEKSEKDLHAYCPRTF
jgi:hypothetical protein